MKKYLFVIARYQDERQDLFEESISPKNKDYCFRHGMEYLLIDNSWNLPDFRENPTWLKFYLLEQFYHNAEIEMGDRIIHFDADMVIVKPDMEYLTEKSFSYAIDSCNSHCMGNFCINLNEWSIGLIKNILDEDLYQKNKNIKFWQHFREQAAWYSLAGIQPFNGQSFLTLPHYGFHSAQAEDAKYIVTELLDHVEVKDPIWNVTLLQEEIDNRQAWALRRLFINKTLPNDTILRHFANKQPWREEYLQ